MIRINLIAERKAAAVKTTKKKPQVASDLQENLILILCILIAVGWLGYQYHNYSSKLNALNTEKQQKDSEYKELAIWKEKQLDYDIRKELLSEKIRKISDLKSRREGPVKLLEDIFNNTPSSVYLESLEQGYDKRLVSPTQKGQKVFSPGNNIGPPNMFKITGYSKTMDAASTMANRLFSLDERYKDGELQRVEINEGEDSSDFRFLIFFKTKADGGSDSGAKEG